MRALAKRAVIPGPALASAPSDVKEDRAGIFAAAFQCGNTAEDEHVSYHRLWNNSEVYYVNEAHYYAGVRASTVVGKVRSLTRGCTSYQIPGVGQTYRLLPEMRLPAVPAGIDASYAFCEEATGQRHEFDCSAYFARGHLLSVIVSISGTLDGAQQTLQIALRLTEQTLLHA